MIYVYNILLHKDDQLFLTDEYPGFHYGIISHELGNLIEKSGKLSFIFKKIDISNLRCCIIAMLNIADDEFFNSFLLEFIPKYKNNIIDIFSEFNLSDYDWNIYLQ